MDWNLDHRGWFGDPRGHAEAALAVNADQQTSCGNGSCRTSRRENCRRLAISPARPHRHHSRP